MAISNDHNVITQEITHSKQLLSKVGLTVKLDHNAFPYAYHHDFVRRCDPKLDRGHIAELMEKFKNKFGERAYIRRTIYGALLFLMSNYPIHFGEAFRTYDFALYFARLSYEHRGLIFLPDELKTNKNQKTTYDHHNFID